MTMWIEEAVFYQIYPLGFCGAPKENDGRTVSRIQKVNEWIPHMLELGIDAIYFSPVFSSDRHGYDTRDYSKIDCRLGTNDDFKQVCENLHKEGIRVVLDGVFNHVGRGFWAFLDVINNREQSAYKDWFNIRFDQDNAYHDGLSYEGWEGHYELVKLNLQNNDVRQHIFDNIKNWVREFDIDGLRLDVAYCLDVDFLKALRGFCNTVKEDFCLIGEVLFGDYNRIVNDEMCHSCTNYECYKGLYSSFNDKNLFEINYSLNRQFGNENHALYKGKHLLSFADNHDVNRLASVLQDEKHIPLVYALLFGMPGIPCIYYGSEWGTKGMKGNGTDDGLRPFFEAPIPNELTVIIEKLVQIRKKYNALSYGFYHTVFIANKQLVFERKLDDESIYVGINLEDTIVAVPVNGSASDMIDLLTEEEITIEKTYLMKPYEMFFWRVIQ